MRACDVSADVTGRNFLISVGFDRCFKILPELYRWSENVHVIDLRHLQVSK